MQRLYFVIDKRFFDFDNIEALDKLRSPKSITK